MANNQGRINFGIGFNIDKTGLNELRSQLQALQNLTIGDLGISKNVREAKMELESIKSVAKIVESALEQSFNKDLGTTNLTKFNQALKASRTNLTTVINKFNGAGAAGKKMANTLTADLLTTNKHIRETSQWLDKMANTMANTVRWSIASAALNSMTGSIQKAYGFTKQLDASLNDIMIVTDKSADDMARFAKQANNAAKNLGAVTTDYTKASLIYYQQGLSDQEVAARAETTMKVANITGQSAEAVSEQLTAVWNGYKVSSQEAELYIDKLSAVAATTAADLEELSTGMSKVASAANIMGVDIDQLNAQLATIVSVTREAPESIGTALKTVYARMSDIEAGLDTETTLGEYTKQMAEMGINALDANGNLRDMGDVVEEIGGKWDTLNRNQQTALAQTIAGTRQYSRMMALFDNWDMYQQAKSTSAGAAGTLASQNEEYMQSMEAHLNRLQTEAEELYSTLFNAEDLKPLIDGLTSIVGLVENIVEGLGGGKGLLGVLGTIGINVFSDKITSGVSKGIRNIKGEIEALNEEKAQASMIDHLQASGVETEKLSQTIVEEIVAMKKEQLKVEKYLTEEQKKQANDLLKEKAKFENDKIELQEKQKRAQKLAENLVSKENLSGDQMALELEKSAMELDTRVFENAFKNWDDFEESFSKEALLKRRAASYSGLSTKHARQYQEAYVLDPNETEQKYLETQQQETSKYLHKSTASESERKEVQAARSEALDRLIQDMETGFESLQYQVEQLQKTGLFKEEDEQRLKDIVDLTEQLKKKTPDAYSQEEVSKLGDAYRDVALYGKKTKEAINEAIQTFQNGEQQANQLEAALRDVEASNKKLINSFDIEVAVQSFTDLAGAASQVVTGFQQLASIGEIWSDEDLTGGEKLLQTITSLSFGLPMLINGLSSAKTALVGINAAKKAFTASTMMSAATTAIETKIQDAAGDQMAENALYMRLLRDCQEDLTEEQMQSILAYYAENEAIEENTKELLKNLAAKKLANGAEVDGTKLDAGKLFKDKIGGGIKQALTKAAPALIIAAFVAAAAAAVAGAYTFIDNWHKKEQKALAETKKLAQEAAENTQLLKESYDQLSSSIDRYKEISTSIDDMVAGTQEYKDAIHEANDELLAMIRQYPELSDQIEKSTEHTGLLVLKTEDALENLLALESAKVSRAQAVEYGLQAQALQAEQDLVIAQQARDMKTRGQTGAEIGTGMIVSAPLAAVGAAGGAALSTALGATAAGAALGSALPIVGTIVGAIVGLAAGAVITVATTSENIQSSNEDLMTRAAKLYNENNALFSGTKDEVKAMLATELQINDDALVESLYENQDAIKELSSEIKALTTAEDAYRVQQADRYLASKGIEHEYLSNVSKEVALSTEDVVPYLEQANKMTDAQVHEYYAKQMDWIYVKNKMGKGEFEYTDANGEIQNKTIDDKTIRAAVAEMMALESEIGAQAYGVIDAIDAVANTGVKAVDDQLANVVTQEELNLKSLTVAERKMFEAALKNLEMISIGTLNEMGIDSVNVLKSYAQESLRNLDEYLDQLATKYISNDRRREQYNNLFTDGGVFADSDLSVANREILAQLYGDLDTSSLNALTNIFSTLGEEAEDFIALLPSLSTEGIEAFKESLAIESEFAELLLDPIFNKFITGVQNAFNLYGQFNKEQRQSDNEFLQSVSSKLKNIGDTISAEDYAKLPAELKTFFTETETGIFALTDAAYKFNQEAKKVKQQELINTIQNTERQKKVEEDKLTSGSLMSSEELDEITAILAEASGYDYHGQNLVDDVKNYTASAAGKIQKETAAMDAAEAMLGFLSTHQWAGQTSGNAVDMLREQGYAVDFWHKKLQKRGWANGTQYDPEMILDLAVLMDQYIAAYEEQLPEETEDSVKGTINELDANIIEAKKQLAQEAGSLAEFEELIQQGLLEGLDESFIEKYRTYYTNAVQKRFEESLDRSFELKPTEDAIESLTTELEKYEEAYSNAFGQGKVDLLEAQIPVLQNLNEQYKLQNDLLVQRAGFYKTSILNDKLNAVGLNVEALQFGADGEILNYNEIMNNAIHWVRQNSPDAEGELRIDELQAALDAYSNYINQIKDNNNLIKQNLITEFDAKLQIKLDTESASREFNQFLRDFENYGADLGEKTQVDLDQEDLISFQNEIVSIQNQLAEVNQQEFDAETAYNKKMKLRLQYENKLREQKEYLISLEDKQVEKLDELNAIYQEQVDYQEAIYNWNKQNLSIQKLLHGEEFYNEESYANAIAAKQKQQELAKEKLQEDIEAMQNYLAVEGTSTSDKAFQQMVANYQESVANYQNAVTATIEELNESYLASIENVFNTFENELIELSGNMGQSLKSLKDEYDWTKELSDYYLDGVNESYQKSQFFRNLDKAAIGASVKVQEKLNELRQDELDTWSKKDKLTQYDLDRANKRLDILKAQIALEEAQQDQSQMRLVRGADGTYGYEYVADQNKILQAEEDLAAAQNELYNMDVKQYESNLERMYSLYEEYKNKMLELASDEDGLTEADIASLQGYVTEIETMALSSQTAFDNVSKTLNGDITGIASTMTTSLGQLADAINKGKFDTVLDGMIADITGPNGLTAAWSAAIQGIKNELYGTDKTEGIFDSFDITSLGFIDAEGKPIDINTLLSLDIEDRKLEAETYVTDVTGKIKQGWEELTTAVGAYQNAVANALSQDINYENRRIAAKDIISASTVGANLFDESYNIKDKTEVEIFLDDWLFTGNAREGLELASKFDKISGDSTYTDYATGAILSQASQDQNLLSWFNKINNNEGDARDAHGNQDFSFNEMIGVDKDGKLFIKNDAGIDLSLSWLDDLAIILKNINTSMGFDTGGYTGEWGSDGRLAMLHEKELVLNKDDTANILTAVDSVRAIQSALNNSLFLALLEKFNVQSHNFAKDEISKEMQVKQQVKIEAIFPGISVAAEVEEALNNIINDVAQELTKNTRG